MNVSTSIIIPTHNRKETLLRSLKALEAQTYPPELMEVIVVADGCTDDTVDTLRNTKTAFTLKVIEQEGKGAAATRNKGAENASGTILIFLDDDIEASPALVEAHVRAQQEKKDRVVIGYLPPVVYCKNNFFAPKLREWWDAAFHPMRHKSHRFNFRNLTSGNFSVGKELFFSVGGFNTEFKCQEDYELGLRFVLRGVQLHFEEAAMGYHHEITDLNKSLKRKYDEGKASILFSQHYPALIPSLIKLKQFRTKIPLYYKTLFFLFFNFPSLAEVHAAYLKTSLSLMERFRRRKSWQVYLDKLMGYYYVKGIAAETGNMNQLKDALESPLLNFKDTEVEMTVDIKEGLESAELKVDERRPSSLVIYYGSHYIGTLAHQYGYEQLRGAHLREILANKFQWEIIEAIAVDNLQERKSTSKEERPGIKQKTHAYTGA